MFCTERLPADESASARVHSISSRPESIFDMLVMLIDVFSCECVVFTLLIEETTNCNVVNSYINCIIISFFLLLL